MVFFSLPVGKEGVQVTMYMCSETNTYLAENQVYFGDTHAHIHVCWSIINTEAVYRKTQSRQIIIYFFWESEGSSMYTTEIYAHLTNQLQRTPSFSCSCTLGRWRQSWGSQQTKQTDRKSWSGFKDQSRLIVINFARQDAGKTAAHHEKSLLFPSRTPKLSTSRSRFIQPQAPSNPRLPDCTIHSLNSLCLTVFIIIYYFCQTHSNKSP